MQRIEQTYPSPRPAGLSTGTVPANRPQAAAGKTADSVGDRVSLSAGKSVVARGAPTADDVIDGQEVMDSQQRQQVQSLKKRDQDVKAHERAHMAAGGTLVQGGATYAFQRGPDGKMYAVGGEVQIDTSPERTPEATIRKMQQVRRAALAPAQPSGTDRAVAARAAQTEARARAEKTTSTTASGRTDANPSASASRQDLSAADTPGQHAAADSGKRIDLRI